MLLIGRTSDHHTADAGSILPESTFNANSLTCACTPPCAIACINICAHIKDPIVHVRVQWIMQTLKHPACTIGWVAQLCHSWLSPGKATGISHGRNPNGTIKEKKKRGLKGGVASHQVFSCITQQAFPKELKSHFQ